MMKSMIEIVGAIEVTRLEHAEVLREQARGDVIGEMAARKIAFERAMHGDFRAFEEVFRGQNKNTIADAYYDLVFDTMLKGDAYTDNVRIGVFGNDVTPSAALIITTFRATLGEATDFTVDGGNALNRATTTFAASSGQSITNSAAPSRFTFTGTDTIYGAFVTQGATLKDGTQDTAPAVYIAGAKFAAAQPVANGSIIDVVYTQSKT